MIRRLSSAEGNCVITVYLALILVLILSLILTVIEGARVSTAKVYAKRALSTAMDSVWAEYYKPLWKEYHLFGYYAGEGTHDAKGGRLEEKLTEYMSYTLSPNTDLNLENMDGILELYDINLSSITISDQTGLLDYKGELLMKEAVEYMKYHEVADGLTFLLEKISLLESPKKVSAIYDKKLAAEEELAKADKNLLRLMELLDGVKTSMNGVELDGEGRLITKNYFVKMLCVASLSREAVGINHEEVFEAVMTHYVNPSSTFTTTYEKLGQLQSVKEQLQRLSIEIEAMQQSLMEVETRLQGVTGKKEEGGKEQHNEPDNEIARLQEGINQQYIRVQELQEMKDQLTTSVEAELKRMRQILQELIPITEEAMGEAEQVILNATSSTQLIDAFEESLSGDKNGLGDEIFDRLKESLEAMKQYTSTYQGDESFKGMYTSLNNNLRLLKNGQEGIEQALNSIRKEDYITASQHTSAAWEELQSYQIAELKMDYSTLSIDKRKQMNPLKEMGNLIQSGIMGLIIDPQSISKKVVATENLPSKDASLTKEGIDFTAMITSFFHNARDGDKDTGMSKLLKEFQNTTELFEGIGEGMEQLTEQLLYQEYLKEHFNSYPVEGQELSHQKPRIINYELEYLLEGKEKDQENLSSVISRIVLIRMILDFVTILGDKAKCEEAKLAAIALVGFSGLPMLVNITQAVLLLIWSFAEALVDTCALLLGKEVPVLKQKLILQFPELFLLNRSFLRTKAESFLTTKQLSFSYRDYLRIFLLTKPKKELIWRSMDLIQENLNLRYEEKTLLRDFLFGIGASADYTMNTRFVAVPFLRKYIKHDLIGYQFTCKAAYCY